MLIVEVPFGKWSHLAYRPLAAYFHQVRIRAGRMRLADVPQPAGEQLAA